MLNNFLSTVVKAGREWLKRSPSGAPYDRGNIHTLCRELMSTRGEASGTALASDVVSAYGKLGSDEKNSFFGYLLDDFDVEADVILEAAKNYQKIGDPKSFLKLMRVAEPPRQELLRRINMAPGGTAMLVGLRDDLLKAMRDRPDFQRIDFDLAHLLSSWFNRGFLYIERIDWHSSATILEKMMRYESVHAMNGWEDFRRRLSEDRRCYAFFHPALPDEPLIFVEVALAKGLGGLIEPLLKLDAPVLPIEESDTALFYSINNCQQGLRGISFGNLLIKQVVLELKKDAPNINTFSTLSPIPGFRKWLDEENNHPTLDVFPDDIYEIRDLMETEDWAANTAISDRLMPILLGLCAYYLLHVRSDTGPLDPVARFHLRNGAKLECINWLGDTSKRGINQSAGMLVNYVYDPIAIEQNHEAFVLEGRIACSDKVRGLLEIIDDP